MGRIKGKYIAQVIINVDMEYTDTDLPIAKVKERFARMMTPMVQEALQKGCGSDAVVEVHQRKADIYEVTRMTVYCDVVECEKCDNGKCRNEFPTGEKAIKLHMNWMGVLLCTDFKESEEYIEMKNEVTE